MKNFYSTLSSERPDKGLEKRPFSRAFTILGILLLMGILSVKVAFGQTTLANYQFNNNLTPDAGAIGSPNLTFSIAAAYNAGATNQALVTGTAASANGCFIEVTLSTVGYSSIIVDWQARTSNATTPGSWVLTGNSGAGFGSAIGSPPALTTAFASSGSLALGAAFNNNPTVTLRITTNNSSLRNMRIDDLRIRGTSASPSVDVTGTLNKFFANQGQPSEPQSLTISGSNLSSNLTVGPLSNYEFSTVSTGPYSSSLSFTPTSGTVSSTSVFVRITNSISPGSYTGTLNFASTGATTVTRTPNGEVYATPLTGFTAGNIVMLRVGETSGPALSSASAPIFLDEYSPTGTFVKSFPLPFSANGLNRRFTMSGSSTSEGYLNLSPDGQYLTFAGYDALPGIPSITVTSAATTNRIVARVTQNGTINTTTRISDGYETNNIRSAATVDGNAFWTGGAGSGGTGGTRYMALGNTGASAQVSTTTTNTRGTAIYNSQLYCSSQSGSNIGVNAVGTGLPTNTGNTTTILAGTATNVDLKNPHGFVFVDQDANGTPDVLYVADADAAAGGLIKFSNSGGTWTKRGSLPNPTGRAIYGITAQAVNATDRRIFLNLGASTTIATEIYSFLDNSGITANITSNGTDIIAACGSPIITSPNAANVGYKGVSFVPVDVPTPTIDHAFTSAGATISQGAVNAPLYRIQCDITNGNALLTGITATTSGLYAASDVNNFRLIVSTDANLDAGDPVISTISTSSGPGQTLAFTGLGQNLPVGTTRYLFITASVSGCATIGSTIGINSIPLSAITYSNPLSVKNGTPAAGTTKSVSLGVLDEVSSLSATTGTPTVNVSWTNPSCVTEVIIVAHTAPITGTPTGTYTGNTNFTSAPAFPGGGRIVYNGSVSPQIITGLTIGTQYYFKVFVRFGANYSAGSQVTATPQLVNLYSRGSGLSHTDAIWSTSPNGPAQTLAASGGMSVDRGIVIQNGHTVQLSSSGGTVLCRELIVNQGGILTATGTLPSDVKYLLLHGNVTNNGTIGTGATFNPISFGAEGLSVTLQGNGIYNLARINKRTVINPVTNLFINANVNVRIPTAAGIHNNTDNTRLNTLVATGKTLTLVETDCDFGLDGTDGLSGGERSGNLIVNGTLNVGGTLFVRNNNTGAGNTCAVTLSAGGTINAGNVLTDFALGQGTNFNITTGGKVNITGALTINSGTLNSNGGIVLKSTAAGTARIANSAGSIAGNITAERYVATGGWHFTGTAIAGQSIADWNDDLATAGPMPGVETPNPGYFTSMIFAYDQTNNDVIPYYGTNTNGWVVPNTSAINQNQGYRVSIGAGSTLDNTGTYATGTKTLTLSSTGGQAYQGYNLVLNPHLSAVNRSGFTFGTGVQNTILVWDPATNRYRYEGSVVTSPITTSGGPSPIASGQGFFLFTTTDGATVTIPESAKSAVSGTFFRTSTEASGLAVRISGLQGESDHAVFQFLSDAQPEYEHISDAYKLQNPGLNVYTLLADNSKMAINALPFEGNQMVIPVGFTAAAGAYTLDLAGIENLSAAAMVFLKDNETGSITELNQNSQYAFVVNTSGENHHRFELIFTQSVTSVDRLKDNIQAAVTVYPNPAADAEFTLAMANLSGKISVEVLDILGKQVYSRVLDSQMASNSIQLPKPAVAGQYLVKVKSAGQMFVRNLIVK